MPVVNGALIIDKPPGLTSHDVVARVRKTIGEKRVGHTGTLDPFATGVLVVLVGKATRLAQFLNGAEKEYEAVIRLGYATDSGDITGARVEEKGPHAKPQRPQSLGKEEIEAAMSSLQGEIEQIPPMYSAKKVSGRKLYEHARRGEEVKRQPIRVTIHEFDALPSDGELLKTKEDGIADLRVRVVCSAGTYIRTLAEDFGKRLGAGAHLAELRRTRAGQFTIEAALTLETLADAFQNGRLHHAIISPFESLSPLPSIDLDDEQLRWTMHGRDLPVEGNQLPNNGDFVRLARGDELIAIGKLDESRRVVHPQVVLTSD